jgi:hypothetical protein
MITITALIDCLGKPNSSLNLGEVIGNPLAEILLDVLTYSPKAPAINRRLKLFCLKNLLLPGLHTTTREELFRFLLAFHPCKEQFTLNDVIPLQQHEHPIVRLLAEKIVTPVSITYPALAPDSLSKIFAQPERFCWLYQQERETFFQLLSENIDNYIVKSQDNDKRQQAALHYGPVMNDLTERYFNRPNRLYPHKKYVTEWFVDMYVFHILREPSALQIFLQHFTHKLSLQHKVMVILLSHPFYNRDAKMALIRSGIALPTGVWTERLKNTHSAEIRNRNH